MAITVINPNIGTPNAPYSNKIVAEYTASGHDRGGLYDEIHIKTAAVTVDFELPLAASFPGKQYTVKYSLGSGVGLARVKPYSLSGADQVEGSASPYSFTTKGDAIILESNGISSWDIKGYYPAGGVPLALPNATSAAVGGVKTDGHEGATHPAIVPALNGAGQIDTGAIDGDALYVASIGADVAADIVVAIAALPATRAGQATITAPATSVDVVFSSAMPSVNYAVTLTQDAAIVATAADVTNRTTTGFRINLSVALTVTYNWIAVANT